MIDIHICAPAKPCLSSDVDECRVLPHLCPHGECINSLGSFRCHCQAGYAPDTTATACLGEPPAPFSEPLLTAPGTHFHEKTKSRKQSSFVSFLHPTLFGPLFSCYLVHPKIFNYITYSITYNSITYNPCNCIAGVHLNQGQQTPAQRLNLALCLFC